MSNSAEGKPAAGLGPGGTPPTGPSIASAADGFDLDQCLSRLGEFEDTLRTQFASLAHLQREMTTLMSHLQDRSPGSNTGVSTGHLVAPLSTGHLIAPPSFPGLAMPWGSRRINCPLMDEAVEKAVSAQSLHSLATSTGTGDKPPSITGSSASRRSKTFFLFKKSQPNIPPSEETSTGPSKPSPLRVNLVQSSAKDVLSESPEYASPEQNISMSATAPLLPLAGSPPALTLAPPAGLTGRNGGDTDTINYDTLKTLRARPSIDYHGGVGGRQHWGSLDMKAHNVRSQSITEA
ncbi:hypothetical protein HK102_007460, partial [Quaeritorhiza haematococci]